MQIGFKLLAEAFGPKELLRQVVAAEEAGFDFVEVSDHIHPWLESQGHSSFVWSFLGAASQATSRIELATGVTCPSMRYHPAIIAQAAATVQLLSDGRFSLGLGSGERLNEHIVGPWPSVSVRQQMLIESIEMIRLLWSGGNHSYAGDRLSMTNARVYDLPARQPPIAVAAGGPRAARIAADSGDGLFVTEARPELLQAYSAAGGAGPRYAEVPLAWASDVDTAAASAHRLFRFGLLGWKLQAELPGVSHFEAAASHIGESEIRENFGLGPDPEPHLRVARSFASLGCDRLALVNAGPDVDGFFEFFRDRLQQPLRALGAPQTA